ncbi:response regulator transcription factor [Mucilaginibacter sp. BT774]|uniref:response regulator transcription factor n=1 Tax=Mucilaginibacter sp. BT774 TaxID=3062276 RepID=UPI0026743D9E|nr:response regulator [Mucilaginibacter sp. BT774]MDO3624655.1 response regulator [Mucilaginibacter sp. BT774]
MKKVLLLDNDEGVLDVMQEALNYEGFKVKTIGETDNIFEVIDSFDPDLIILDYILSGINGGEICHQIKANPKTTDLPVIIISAYPRVIQSLGYYGCDDFISKPFDLDDISERIKRLIDREMA